MSTIAPSIIFALALTATAGEFPGWESMRVIEQEGRPWALRAADVNGDGRQELIVVNTRQSRLDLYRWLPPGERQEADAPHPKRPNDLPMAPELDHEELTLEHLPLDVAASDLDGDGRDELIVLVTPPNRILVYGFDAGPEPGPRRWTIRRREDLLEGNLGARRRSLLTRPRADGLDLLISTAEGIQVLSLGAGMPPTWLAPREKRDRIDWWLADLDGDGDDDLVELTTDAASAVRWYQTAPEGHLMPAATLFNRAVAGGCSLEARPGQGAGILLLDATARGVLRRYRLQTQADVALGRQRGLPAANASKAVWCGLRAGDRATMVIADRQSPRLLVHPTTPAGWGPVQSYPGVADVQSIAAPQAEPGTLLLQTKDGSDLLRSTWEGGRLTYPIPSPQSADVEDRRILRLGSIGTTTWWVQRVAANLDLYVWPANRTEPARTRFAPPAGCDAGDKGCGFLKVRKVMWPGGDRLLVKLGFDEAAKLLVRDGDRTQVLQPSHLKKLAFAEFRLIDIAGRPHCVRFTDGAMQWLDEQLRPTDQVMLFEGRRMGGYVPLDGRRGWSLEQEGRFIHLLEADDANIARVTESIQTEGGVDLVNDPVLGIVLVGHDRLTQLSDGDRTELRLVASIDRRVGQPRGEKNAMIHRVANLAVAGDRTDVLLFDDRRHQLTLLADDAGDLKPVISWPVFEDRRYPYSGDQARVVPEPRVVVGLNLDGDDRQDLAMACHDRIIFYLAQVDDGDSAPGE